MSSRLGVVVVTALICLTAAAQTASQDPPSRVARLSYMDGQVNYRPGGEENWTPASLNLPLVAGDAIWSDANSRVEMHLGSTAMRAGSQTGVNILDIQDHTLQVRLTEGTFTLRVRTLEPNDVVEVDTLNVATTITAPGEYRFIVYADTAETIVAVRSGRADARFGGQTELGQGQMLRVRGTDNPESDLLSTPPPDEWDTWSQSRDDREDRAVSARYVSREMTGYEDLDSYGDWNERTAYGPMWFPRSVSAGWAPYRDGRWAWIEPWGWTWVDDSPWGFAPFHYGRWTMVGGRWGWAPGRMGRPVYSPALVGFAGGAGGAIMVGGGPHVAWFPLGPGELYRPGYHHSPGYLSGLNHGHVANIGAWREGRYMHQNSVHGVTMVSHGLFTGGGSLRGRMAVVDQRHLSGFRSVGATAMLAPRRESIMGHSGAVRGHIAAPRYMDRVTVVTRHAAPPPRVSFAARERMLQSNPGRPLDHRTMEGLRSRTPVHSQPVVRHVPDKGRGPVVRSDRPTGYMGGRPGGPGGSRDAGVQRAPSSGQPGRDRPGVGNRPQPLSSPPQIDRGNRQPMGTPAGQPPQIDRGNRPPQIDRGNRQPMGTPSGQPPQVDRGNRQPTGTPAGQPPQVDRGRRQPPGTPAGQPPQVDRGRRQPPGTPAGQPPPQVDRSNRQPQGAPAGQPPQIDRGRRQPPGTPAGQPPPQVDRSNRQPPGAPAGQPKVDRGNRPGGAQAQPGGKQPDSGERRSERKSRPDDKK